eukprot:TRINITY_DN4256_c2_g1_i1.p1 TRINITY_DN4256_c2_g1~~TRINITY_DN4256_c2_g1_i1.p1  ORF type:complete len:1845 (-),score=487.68 TRINITY_DN4256_c2_g1_i1:43-5547(-)
MNALFLLVFIIGAFAQPSADCTVKVGSVLSLNSDVYKAYRYITDLKPNCHDIGIDVDVTSFASDALVGSPLTRLYFYSTGEPVIVGNISLNSFSYIQFGAIRFRDSFLSINSTGNVALDSCYFMRSSSRFSNSSLQISNTQFVSSETFRSVSVLNGSLSVVASSFLECKGGAIECRGDCVVNSTLFKSNVAEVGSAIYSEKDATINNCTFISNIAQGYFGGGAVFMENSGTIRDSIFEGNSASYSIARTEIYPCGGAVSIFAVATIERSQFYGNTAFRGGAMCSSMRSNPTPTSIIRSSILRNNSASVGGAVALGWNLDIYNSSLISNRALILGGVAAGTAFRAYNSTFDLNSADVEGGIFVGSYCSFFGSTISNSKSGTAGITRVSFGIEISTSKIMNNNAASSLFHIVGVLRFTSTDSEYIGNSVTEQGIFQIVQDQTNPVIDLRNCRFEGNTAFSQGLFSTSVNNLLASNFTFINNYGTQFYQLGPGMITIDSCNFKGNKGTTDGIVYSISKSELFIKNSNFEDNSSAKGSIISSIQAHVLHFTNNSVSDSSAETGGVFYMEGGYHKNQTTLISGNKFLRCHANLFGGVLYYTSTATSPVKVYVEDNYFQKNTASSNGGSIWIQKSSVSEDFQDLEEDVSLNRNTFDSNVAGFYGGSIYATGDLKSFHVRDSYFTNSTSFYGGGISCTTLVGFDGSNLTFSQMRSTSGGALHFSRVSVITATGIEISNGSATNGGGIFIENSVDTARFKSINIQHCTSDVQGAAIAVIGTIGLLTIEDSQLSNNYAQLRGGGISFFGSSIQELVISKVEMSNNSVILQGGHIFFDGNLRNVTIEGCNLSGGTSLYGGAIYSIAPSTLSILNSNISNNRVENRGGAFYLSALSSLSIVNSTFFNNRAEVLAGFAYIQNTFISFEMLNSTVEKNSSPSGGGIYVDADFKCDVFKINGSTFSSNVASGLEGGAIRSIASFPLEIYSSHFYSNSATKGGSIFYQSVESFDSSVQIFDTEFESNIAEISSGGGAYFAGSFTNLLLKDSKFQNNKAESGAGLFLGITNEVDVRLVGNEFVGNSAVNRGGGCFAESEILSMEGNHFDANEAPNGAGIYRNSVQNSRSTMNYNHFSQNLAQSGAAILFDGDSKSIVMNGNFFNRNKASSTSAIFLGNIESLKISNASFASNVGISGSALYLSPSNSIQLLNLTTSSFYQNYASESGGSICLLGSLSEIFIRDTTFSSDTSLQAGGSIYASPSSSRTFHLTGNQFNQSKSVDGGAIFVDSTVGNVTMSDNTFASNQAKNDGGSVNAKVSLHFLRFRNNSCLQSNATRGGCMYLTFPLTGSKRNEETAQVSISNSHFESSNAVLGGALFLNNENPERLEISSSSFIQNNAIHGGAVVLLGHAVLDNSTFSDNVAVSGTSLESDFGHLDLSNNQFNPSAKAIRLNSTSAFASVSNNNAEAAILLGCDNNQLLKDENGIQQCVLNIVNTEGIRGNDVTSSSNLPTYAIIIIVVVVVLVLAGIMAAIVIIVRKNRKFDQLSKTQVQMIDFSSIDLGGAKDIVIKVEEIKIEETVGSGAFGIVYRADWRGLKVAVKQIKSDDTPDQVNFLKEVCVLKALRPHPNIVTFLGITLKPLALVLEFCSGGSLDHYLALNKVSIDQKVAWILGISRGILHLHNDNIIHRDLAARNVLLTHNLDVKIADFGLSREQEEGKTSTMTQSYVGPIKWMAPEMFQNGNVARSYSKYSDVWSFGILMLEILEEHEPYPGKTPLEVAFGIRDDSNPLKPQLSEKSISESPLLAKLFEGCTKRDPFDRPSFQEIINYLPSTESISISNQIGSGVYVST